MTPARLAPLLLCLLTLAACRTAPQGDPVAVGPPAEEAPTRAPAVEGVYEAALPAGSAAGRHIALALRADGSASMETAYRNGEPPILQTGTWQAEGARVLVALDEQDGRPVEEPLRFEQDADGTLRLVDYDPAAYGSQGITLRRSAEGPGGEAGSSGRLAY